MNEFLLLISEFNLISRDLNDFLLTDFRVKNCEYDHKKILRYLREYYINCVVINLQNADLNSIKMLKDVVARISKSDIPIIIIGTMYECEYFEKIYAKKSDRRVIRPIHSLQVVSEAIKDVVSVYENKKRCILVVDDDGGFLRTIKLILEKYYKINLANSALTAMTSVGREKPDLILLDYEMPVCDGQKLLEMIRADEDIKNLPVIIFTGVTEREKILSILNLNIQGYILKGSDSETVLEHIQNFFHK